MSLQFPAINYFYFLAFVMATALGVINIRNNMERSSLYWLGVLFSFSIWTLGELLANLGTTFAWQLGFQRVVYLGVVSGVLFWMLFAIHYSGHQRWLSPITLVIMLIVPACTLVLVATLEWHHLLYRHAELIFRDNYYVLKLDYGIGFWAQLLLCSYLYTVTGSWLLVSTARREQAIFRTQSRLIIIAAMMPLIANILYVFGVDFTGGFDPTSIVFVFSAMLITVATNQYHFLSFAPIARDLVFRSISMGVVVVNGRYKITDINPAFVSVVAFNASELIGKDLAEVLENSFRCQSLKRESTDWHGQIVSRNKSRTFDVTSMPITDTTGEVMGYIILVNDVTQIQSAMDEISRLADTDLLTQLPNRRALIDWVDALPEPISAERADLVVIADLDRFKELNDNYGHNFGDDMLAMVAGIIRENLGPEDKAARWGGEEFCMVLVHKTMSEGEQLLERMRLQIETSAMDNRDASIKVTVTFGMVRRLPHERFGDAIRRADLLMYDGKRQGRNRVIVSSCVSDRTES